MPSISKIETSNAHQTLKVGLTAVASVAIWFYAGPVASIAAKEVFKMGYDVLYGVPNWYNPSYFGTYIPLREHIGHYAFEYGGLMLGSLCAPVIYKGISFTSDLGGKVLTQLGVGVPEEKRKVLLPLLLEYKKDKSSYLHENDEVKQEGLAPDSRAPLHTARF